MGHVVPQTPTDLTEIAAKITTERHWSHVELPAGIIQVLQDLARAGVSKEVIRERTALAKKIIFADESCHTHTKLATLLHVIKSPSPFLHKWHTQLLFYSSARTHLFLSGYLALFLNIQNMRHIFLFPKGVLSPLQGIMNRKCPDCPWTGATGREVADHRRTRHAAQQVVCPYCPCYNLHQTPSSLKRHIRSQHPGHDDSLLGTGIMYYLLYTVQPIVL